MRPVKAIDAGGIGGGGAHGSRRSPCRADGDVLDPGFPCILDAVGVGVIPDEVAEGGELIEARVQVMLFSPAVRVVVAVMPVVVLASESTVSSPPAFWGLKI